VPSVTASMDGLAYWTEIDYALSANTPQMVMPTDGLGQPATGSVISVLIDLQGLRGNSDNVGIDNITFSQIAVAPVPLPAALPLLLAGLGGLAIARRRKA